MIKKKKICPDCKTEFEYDPKARFKKRYCDTCSKERKEAYENIHEISIDDCED